MKTLQLLSVGLLLLVCWNCTDHEPPTNPPAEKCKLFSGEPRPYDCEFVVERLVFLTKINSIMAIATPDNGNVTLLPDMAKSLTVSGSAQLMKVDVKLVVRRVANPAFTPMAGYKLTSNTVSLPLLSDATATIGSPVAIPIPIGGTQEIPFELSFVITDYATFPNLFAPVQFIALENDVTTTKFVASSSLKRSDVAEAHIVLKPRL